VGRKLQGVGRKSQAVGDPYMGVGQQAILGVLPPAERGPEASARAGVGLRACWRGPPRVGPWALNVATSAGDVVTVRRQVVEEQSSGA
jgi:hypothetical protein